MEFSSVLMKILKYKNGNYYVAVLQRSYIERNKGNVTMEKLKVIFNAPTISFI